MSFEFRCGAWCRNKKLTGDGDWRFLCQAGEPPAERAVCGLIRTAETPEARVAIVTTIRPNEGEAEPHSLDKTSSRRPAHQRTFADRAFADSFGKSEMHGSRPSSVCLGTIMRRWCPSTFDGAATLCAADILTVRTVMTSCTIRGGY